MAPNDQDARLKMQECEKMVKKINFLKAIEVGEPASAAEGLDLASMGGYSLGDVKGIKADG
jgi:serine/threonine-protein phosphatase 5